VSADGEWRSSFTCADDNCTATVLTLTDASGAKRDVRMAGNVDGLQWSPAGHVLAIRSGGALQVIVEPARDAPRSIASGVGGFAWRRDNASLIVAENGNLDRVRLDGKRASVAKLAGLPPYLYASPDRARFAYTASDPAGWQLFVYDDNAGKVVFSGAMGSDGPGGRPVEVSPNEVKSPMFIAWSPDGTKLAFGGGYEAPYFMTLIDLTTGSKLRTDFSDGYPGEIVWTADGKGLAVSTYDPERRHHGAYVVDPATGAARWLVSGCHLVWSPDGRFLALKGEHDKGVGIVDVASGDHAQLTRDAVDAPIAWVD
jgi:hypothetical protein